MQYITEIRNKAHGPLYIVTMKDSIQSDLVPFANVGLFIGLD